MKLFNKKAASAKLLIEEALKIVEAEKNYPLASVLHNVIGAMYSNNMDGLASAMTTFARAEIIRINIAKED